MKLKLKHVQKVKKRGHPGEYRFYLRAGVGRPKRVSLPGEPGSPEFMAAYHAGFVENGARADVTRAPKGTVAWMIDTYREHPDFTRRPASMRQKHNRHLTRFRAEHGKRIFRQMTTDHLKRLMEGIGIDRGPNAANQWLDAIRDLCKFACVQGEIVVNPAARDRIEKFDREGDGHATWTHDEVKQYRDCWAIGTRERLVLELALALALRRSDLIRIKPSAVKHGELTYTQHKGREHKGGVTLTVPITPELQVFIDATRRAERVFPISGRPDRFVLTAQGRAYAKDDSISDWFRGACNLAKLPQHCVLHGLRKRSCADMIDAGKTPDQVRAISGHQTYAQLLVYVRGRDQKRLAREALAA